MFLSYASMASSSTGPQSQDESCIHLGGVVTPSDSASFPSVSSSAATVLSSCAPPISNART